MKEKKDILEKNQKILIIQTAFLGDLILSTGFFQKIRNLFPDATIHVIVNKGTESILENHPGVDLVLSFDKKEIKKTVLGFFDFLQKIRSENYDLVFSPHFSHRSSIISFATRAQYRFGYSNSGFGFLHTHAIFRQKLSLHETQKLNQLAELARNVLSKNSLADRNSNSLEKEASDLKKTNGLSEAIKPQMFFTKDEEKNFQKFRDLQKLKGEYIVIAPSSLWETKRLPEEQFVKLVELLFVQKTLKLVFAGSKADQPLVDRIFQLLKEAFGEKKFTKLAPQFLNLAGSTDLRTLALLVKYAKGIISNDSSPIHFASCFNTPILAFFGATIPAFGYGPVSQKQFISEVIGLDCRPCGIHGGKVCPERHFRCMKDQDLEKAQREFIKLLKEKS